MSRRYSLTGFVLGTILLLLTACGGSAAPTNTTQSPASKQVLTFPNVGTSDANVTYLDPAQGADANTAIVDNMIYSGLVQNDKDLNVIPDQATWQVSSDNKVYTFTLKSGITFSDGTPVTAQSYVYTWTRALLPATNSPIASFFAEAIAGSDDVQGGKTPTLSGVKAVDDHTLQVTLKRPTSYFLSALTNIIFFPLNQKVIEQYGDKNWTKQVVGSAVGTGPFIVKSWDHNSKMIFVPNPHYYGNKTKLTEVDMIFVNNQGTAYKSYRAGQYDFVWDLASQDQETAKSDKNFVRRAILQTDILFFDNRKAPFDNLAVRQAFAYATDKAALAHAIFKDAVVPAPTIIPPGMPGYQANYAGLQYDAAKAKSLLLSVYPDVTKVPSITFTYPNSQMSTDEVAALQNMWQSALGVQIKVEPMDLNAYTDVLSKHQVQFGFIQWSADFPDPYDWLTLNLTSNANNNNGEWKNPEFDRLVTDAESASGDQRISLYNQAEQLAVTQVGWLPLDHQSQAAIFQPWVHGVILNGFGLFFGDWSQVYLTNH